MQADIRNSFGEDTGLEKLRYLPLTHELTSAQLDDFILAVKEQLIDSPHKEPVCPQGVTPGACDTLKALARFELDMKGGRRYYRYVDGGARLGDHYFYAVVAFDHSFEKGGALSEGVAGDPASNFAYVVPKSAAQPSELYDESQIYVVPNPATKETMAEWALGPTNDDPTGTKVEFRNLPRSKGVIRVYTIAGDLVQELPFDGRTGVGTVAWDLVSRNGQDVASGVYLYSIEFEDSRFSRVIKKFTVIR
jgi:hypothetical protein